MAAKEMEAYKPKEVADENAFLRLIYIEPRLLEYAIYICMHVHTYMRHKTQTQT